MDSVKKLVMLLACLLLAPALAHASFEQLSIDINEYVDQYVTYNPLKDGDGIWNDTSENQSFYNLTGYITIENQNADGIDLADLYISISYTSNITLPTLSAGRNGTWISNDTSSENIILHIPQLRFGENSTWVYSINTSNIRPPLNFTSNYSDFKILAGNNFSVSDKIHNVFDTQPHQLNTCIYDINITQNLERINFSGTFYNFTFIQSSVTGLDAGNVSITPNNQTLSWVALNSTCLNQTNETYISYTIDTPINIPDTTHYPIVNSTLRYKLNETISHIKVVDINVISEAELSFEKRIIAPSDPILYGSNVTWNVTGYFTTGTNITYNLTEVTFWVSQRNVNGSYTDPNAIDNDTISNATLITSSNPNTLVNLTTPWASNTWLFNYSDIPSPIVWMNATFEIENDGTQLVNRTVTQNGNDIHIKELYLIIGYWLEVDKNITSIAEDEYNIRIDVHNKGNQVTPKDAVVTIYDFVPNNYNITSPFVYSTSPWYNTTSANTSINGTYNGTLFQWGLLPNNFLNTSFFAGPARNENTTWSVEFNVTGTGDYTLLDVFVTGLDPQKVDGAGSSKAVIVNEILDRLKSTEGIFAIVASVLAVLALLL